VVAVFARLKWRLTTSRIRTAASGTKAATAIGIVVGIVVSGAVAVGLIALRGHQEIAVPAITGLFTAQLLAWMVSPLLAFGIDQAVDPQKFALLPIPRPTLQRGLLVASLIGYLPIANAVVLIGAAVALARPWGLLPLTLACAAVQLVMCVVFSRATATSMSSLMSSRRGRDLGMAVGFGAIALYLALSVALNSQVGASAVGSSAKAVAGVLAWGPTGALAGLGSFVATGSPARALVAVVTAVVVLAFGWWWWGRALRTALTTVPSTTAGSTPAGGSSLGTAVADSQAGMARLVAGRDARLAWRDPMRRLPWLIVLLLAVGWPFIVVHGRGSVFAVALGAVLVGAQSANQLGIEGSGLWLHLVAFSDLVRARGEMIGHAVVSVVPGTVVITLGILVQAAFRGGWSLLPAAFGVCLAAMLGAIGGGCLMSAALPYAMPQSRSSMFASSVPGQKGRSAGASFAVLGIGIATAAPAGAFGALAMIRSPGWGWLGLLVGVATGAIVFPVLVRLGARRYVANGPEILAVVSLGDRT
jgi:ABC-2 type transport system permease protein